MDGSSDVALDASVVVSVERGTLRHVDVVDGGGRYLSGGFSEDRATWTSTTSLIPGRSYSVAADALGEGGSIVSSAASFATKVLPAAQQLRATMAAPANGSTVGVAYPLVVGFNRPVLNRRTVTSALQVRTSPHVEGAWYWVDAHTVDYRPREFWPAGTKVELHSNLDGVFAGNGLWGTANTVSGFTVGRRQIVTVNVDKRLMTTPASSSTTRRGTRTSARATPATAASACAWTT